MSLYETMSGPLGPVMTPDMSWNIVEHSHKLLIKCGHLTLVFSYSLDLLDFWSM